jgi:hypothetical protein
MAEHIFEVAYEELVEELRYNLKERDDEPVPVYPSAYDWRQPARDHRTRARRLRRRGDRAHQADQALPQGRLRGRSAGQPDRPFHGRPGHRRLPRASWPQCARGQGGDPGDAFQGSFEAVVKISTGTATLSPAVPGSREREAPRLTPALYHPAAELRGCARGGAGHSAITVRSPRLAAERDDDDRRVHPPARTRRAQSPGAGAPGIRGHAGAGREMPRAHSRLRLKRAGLQASDWLRVVGVDAETRVRLRIARVDGAVDFQFRSADRQNQWEEIDPQRRRLTGDGTVPTRARAAVPRSRQPGIRDAR